ncbi:DUF2634 domain-containing protein [Leptotrichia sp. OH3620_COT-345]|uniref:DUF2634 domain-containing protein n=1 Tax=Leptotrichia sp. OH3620_COT-345 TaxID=2491048 RepID=UPI000F64D000|nr:DUF2634 domain-containing protein [Leptotrichia sp. OH3620_COT-345]RRD38823.1 DUF2634 domain-containing protein [Leptotrichia sp. OH3620_COT-345]
MSLPNSMLSNMKVYGENKNIEAEEEKPRFELKWDFKKNDFLYDEKGSPVLLKTKKEIVKQWIIKCLIVTKNAWRIYYKDKSTFGVGIQKYKGRNPLTEEFLISEIKREIIEALREHKYIKSIENYYSIFEQDKLNFEFDVVLNSAEKEILKIDEVFEFGN